MNFDGILFFPVTPFDADGRVDDDLLRAAHLDAPSRTRPAASSPRAAPASSTRCRPTEAAHASCASPSRPSAGTVPVVAGHGRAARARDRGRARGRRRRRGRAARAAALPGRRPAGGTRRLRRGDRRGIRSSRRDLPPRHRAVLGRLGAPARPQPEGRRLQGRRRRRRPRAADRPRGRRDGPRRLRVLQRPADRGADPGRLPRHRHPAVLVGGVRDGPRDRERVLPRVRRRRRGAPRSRCSTASTAPLVRAARRDARVRRLAHQGRAAPRRAAGRQRARRRSSTRRPSRRSASPRSSRQGARCCDAPISALRRAAGAGAAHPALGERRHVGRRDRDARRALGRRRGLGLLVDAADRRRGRARAARARHRPVRDRARRRPRGSCGIRCGSTCTRPGGGGLTTIALAGLDLALWDAAARARGSARSPICSAAARHRCARTAAASTCTTRSTSCSRRSAAGSTPGFDAVKIKVGKPDLAEDVDRVARGARAARPRPRAHDRRQPALGPRPRDPVGRRARGVRAGVDRRAAARRRPLRPRRARAAHRRADRGRREPAHGVPLRRVPRAPAPRRSCSPTSCGSAASRRSAGSRRSPPSTACRCIRTCCPSSPASSR